jgi:hypothetical protein
MVVPTGRHGNRCVHAQTIRESLLDPLTPAELDLLDRALSRITEN